MKKNKQAPLLQFTHDDVSITSVHSCYQGFFKMNEYSLSHKLFSGEQSESITREIFERGDAVVVMLYDPINDVVVMLEQFRPGALRTNDSPWLLEFVAGMFNENESPIDVAVREVKEEANITIKPTDLTPVMKYLSSPGGTSECIHLYVALVDSTNVGGVYGLAEEHEDILLHTLSRQQALVLLEEGKITNAATIIGLQWLAMNYQQFPST